MPGCSHSCVLVFPTYTHMCNHTQPTIYIPLFQRLQLVGCCIHIMKFSQWRMLAPSPLLDVTGGSSWTLETCGPDSPCQIPKAWTERLHLVDVHILWCFFWAGTCVTLECTKESCLLEPPVAFFPFISLFHVSFESLSIYRSHFPAGYTLKVK